MLKKTVNKLFALFLIVGIIVFTGIRVVGIFFIIRTYIKSEISIKEIDMSKYWGGALFNKFQTNQQNNQ